MKNILFKIILKFLSNEDKRICRDMLIYSRNRLVVDYGYDKIDKFCKRYFKNF